MSRSRIVMASSAAGRRQASRAALAVSDDVEIERLSTPDGRAWTAWMLLYLAVWAVLVALVAVVDSTWVLMGLSALLGSQLHALTVLQHDCGHRSAYPSAAANRRVGRLLAWFVFMPFTTFTELHRRHHGFLGDPAQDPDEWFYERGPRWLFVRECLFMPRFIVLSLQRLPAGPRRQVVAELAFNAVTHAGLAAALAWFGAWTLLVFAHLLPMLWLAVVFNPISRGYEHLPMATLAPDDPRRADLRHNTISVTGRVMGLLWANIGYHVEHHLHARVPFFRLPALHRLMAGKAYRTAPWPLHRLRAHAGTRGTILGESA